MARKLPKLEHVKYVRAKGKLYAYFNTGRKNSAGHPIRVRLPDLLRDNQGENSATI